MSKLRVIGLSILLVSLLHGVYAIEEAVEDSSASTGIEEPATAAEDPAASDEPAEELEALPESLEEEPVAEEMPIDEESPAPAEEKPDVSEEPAEASAEPASEKSKVKMTTGIEARWSIGQIMKSRLMRRSGWQEVEDWLDYRIFGFVGTIFSIGADMQDKVAINLDYFANITYKPDITDIDEVVDTKRSGSGGILGAYGTIALKDNISDEKALLQIGYFPYQYAPNGQSFGMYMFRTGIYPGYVISGYGPAFLPGLRLAIRLPETISHDLILITDFNSSDISLAYLLGTGNDALKINAGIMLERFIKARARFTSPVEGRTPTDSTHVGYTYIENGDTLWEKYSNSGVKLMARACLDFKEITGLKGRLSERDLRLYAEAAVLGVKNYKGYYENIVERIPVTVGLNLPTFKLIDLLAWEVEYYGSPWKDAPGDDPTPYENFEYELIYSPKDENAKSDKGKTDNFKWALVAEKKVRKITIRAKTASDHFGYPGITGQNGPGSADESEHFFAPDQWYWQLEFIARL